MIVGISGAARSGKDTAAGYLIRRGFVRYSFADPLKRAASEMFSVPLNEFYDDNTKDAVHPYWGITRRAMLQKLGEGGRNIFGSDIWIRRAAMELDTYTNVVIPDVRYENEAAWIKSKGGMLLHIQRKNKKEIEQHVSENGYPKHLKDAILNNDGTIDNLYQILEEILQYE